MKKYKLW